MSSDEPGTARRSTLSRRSLLGAAAAGTAGLVVGGIARPLVGPLPSESTDSLGPVAESAAGTASYSFFGTHQAGVTTPVQDHVLFAAFDMVDGTDRADLGHLLREWSDASALMTQGVQVGETDTGEVMDLPANALTVTVGFGPHLFDRDGDPYEIAAARPAELEQLPTFVGDALEAPRSHGDLGVQFCADDPQVAVHALHNLARIAAGRAAIRWSQQGFLSASRASAAHPTPRNLMGFKDGTNNILEANEAVLDQHVWVRRPSTPDWLAGGTYLVVRKIQMLLDDWDRESTSSQEAIIGRVKESGGPLSGGDEFTSPDFEAKVDGADAIDRAAHVRLAHPSTNDGIRILRRGYNYVDGTHPDGRLAAGLLFIAYQQSPSQFITIQRALAPDMLNKFVRHIGSAVFVVPPGASEGGFVGETLLA